MTKSLSRLVIINDRSVGRGGATGLAMLSAEKLAERGHEVVYLAADAGHNADLTSAGVTVLGAGGTALMKKGKVQALTQGLYNPSAVGFLRRWIAEEGRPDDVYHLHGWAQTFSPGVFRALRPVRNRLVVHAHDFFLACPNGGYWNYQKTEFCPFRPMSASCITSNCDKRSFPQKVWRLARHAVRQALFSFGQNGPQILLIHPSMADYLARAGFSRDALVTVRNPVIPFCSEPVSASQNKSFVFVGRLDTEKGPDVAARAAAAANVPIMMIGEGPQAETIRNACPHAEMLGWRDRTQLPELLARARALIMPSRYPEPYGLVAVEALSSGIPVLISDTAFLAPEVEEAGAGLSFSVKHPDQLATILADLASEDARIEAMAKNGLTAAGGMGNTLDAWLDQLTACYARATP